MTTHTTSPTTACAATLRAHGFVGPVIEPGHGEYESSRLGWNAAIDRRPAAIAYASGADDVGAAIRAASAMGIEFTIRSGGHSMSGRSTRDDALCIDLRALRAIDVDPKQRRVGVGGGALLSELDAATQEHGLAVPAGQISHTGVGGLTLGGGLGWLMRQHGLTIDSMLEAEVVLSDGMIVRAAHDEHPDLFWALRGGGGDFGVVTRFEFRAHPVGPLVLAGLLVYPWDRAGETFRAARDLMETAPEELGMFVVLLTAPPEPPFPPALQGRKAVALGVAWTGDPAEGDALLARLRSSCPPGIDLVQPMPYVALQSMLDGTAPHGNHYYSRLHYVERVHDGLIDKLIGHFESVPTPLSHVVTGWMHGAVQRVPAQDTAFGHRAARALTWFIGESAEGPIGPIRDWVRGAYDATAVHATGGTYVNALPDDEPFATAYRTDILERLVEIKRRYDPQGRFSAVGIG